MFGKFFKYAFAVYMTFLWGSVIGMIIKSLVAKELGKDAFGQYTFMVSLVVVMGSVFTFGLPDVMTKAIAEKRDYSGVFNRFALTLVLALTIASTLIGVITWGTIEEVYSIALLALGPVTLMPIANAIFRGEIATKHESSYRFLRRVLELGLMVVFIFVFSQSGNLIPVYAILISWYLASAYVIFLLRRRQLLLGPQQFMATLKQSWLRRNMSFAGFLWLAGIITILGNQADTLIVGTYLGFTDLGEYGGALLFNTLIGQVIGAMDSIFVSIMAREENRELNRYQNLIGLNVLIVPLFSLALLPFIGFLTPILLDDTYKLVLPLFALMSLMFVFKSVEPVNRAVFISIDRPQGNTQSTILAVVLYLPTLLILVSRWQLAGAAISFVLFWVLYNGIQIYLLKKYLPVHAHISARMTLVSFAIFLIALAAYFVVPDPVLSAALPTLLYVGLGQITGLWDLRQAVRLGRELINRRMQKRPVPGVTSS
jgi:O-antigen/teichoic acid export membrane protein